MRKKIESKKIVELFFCLRGFYRVFFFYFRGFYATNHKDISPFTVTHRGSRKITRKRGDGKFEKMRDDCTDV